MTTANWIILIGGAINVLFVAYAVWVYIVDWHREHLRRHIIGMLVMALATLILWVKVFIDRWEW